VTSIGYTAIDITAKNTRDQGELRRWDQLSFSLLGGPLHQLGRRLGLVRGDTNTALIGLMLGPGLWLVIVTLALMEGVEDRLFDLSLVAGHARLLVIIPLFFACESRVGPRMTAFVATIARTGVVPPAAQSALHTEVARQPMDQLVVA
jgi:hypothetical protein